MPIDVHAHYVPPQLIAAVTARGGELGVRLAPSPGNAPPALHFDYGFKVRPFFPRLVEPVAQRIAWLDEQGIDLQVVGTWPDIFGYGLAPDACAAWHRMLNETLAEWCDDNAGRFAWIGSVPLTQADAAAQELDRIATTGGCGVIISSNIENVNIGELPLDPFWRKAEALGLPVLIHPVLVGPAPRAAKFGLAQVAQYTFDTTLGVGSLLLSGVLDRFPGLKLVLSHGGGAYPYLAGRFDIMHRRMDRRAQGDMALKAPSAYASQMAYDSIVHAPKALRFLVAVAGLDNVVLGTDYSFPPADMEPLALLRAAGLPPADVSAIADGNPRRIFARLKDR
ncbi:MAG TPA: amidohydrolase family protein [Xanthobacteraceae bacterium]|nr:amidohydrolase family protein [Xanthobacteraceae bacterium]